MMTFQPHMEILPTSQQSVWPLLAPVRELGFVLYGGTAIALRLGHRTSIDFDFFTDQTLDRVALLKKTPFLTEGTLLQDKSDSFTAVVHGVKFSFFGGLSFGRFSEPSLTSDHILQVAALDDLLALKIKVIHQRSEVKDFQDIAAILRHGIPLEKGLAIAEQMFTPNFSPMIALRALTYFEEGDVPSLSKEDKKTLIEATQHPGPLPEVMRISRSLS